VPRNIIKKNSEINNNKQILHAIFFGFFKFVLLIKVLFI